MKSLEIGCKVLIVGGPIENIGKEGTIVENLLVGETTYWRVKGKEPLWGYATHKKGAFEKAPYVGFETHELRRIDGEEFDESSTSESEKTPSTAGIQSPCRETAPEVHEERRR